MKNDISIRAIMEIKKYTVKLSGSNCSFTGAGTYSCGTKVTISCKPKDGYRFVQWNDGDTNPEKTFVIAKNHTYTATCEKVDGVICLPTSEHTYKFNNIGEFEIDTDCNSLYVNMPTQRAWTLADFSAYITSDGNFVRSPKFVYNYNEYSYPNIEVIDAKKIMFKSGDKLTIKIKPTTTIKRIQGQDPLIVMRLIGTDYKGVDDRYISEGVVGLDNFNKNGAEIKLTAYSDCVGFSIDFYNVIVDKELFDITITKTN